MSFWIMTDKENFLTSTPVVDRSSNDRPVNRESPITSRLTRANLKGYGRIFPILP